MRVGNITFRQPPPFCVITGFLPIFRHSACAGSIPSCMKIRPLFLPLLMFVRLQAADVTPENFVRTTETPEKLSAVQTRIVEYRPVSGTGPSILLVGAAHLGTEEYYAALQKRLDA